MHIQYDAQVDALTIQLTSGRGRPRTVQVAPGVHLDFDRANRLIALELLDASHHVPRHTLEQFPSPKRYLTLVEAAKESRLSADTLRSQIHKGRIAAIKRGRDWLVDATALTNYLESRDTRGRPATHPRARVRRRGNTGDAITPKASGTAATKHPRRSMALTHNP